MTPPRDPRQGWLLGGPLIPARPGHGVEQLGLDLGPALQPTSQSQDRDALTQVARAMRAAAPETAEELGRRWGAWCRARHPERGAAKRLAREFDVSHRTAEGWLCDRPPSFPAVSRALGLDLPGVLTTVFGVPAAGLAAVVDIDRQADALEERISALAQEFARARGGRGR